MNLRELSFTAGGCKAAWTLWKTAGWFLKKLNMLLPSNPAIKFLGIYPEEFQTSVHTITWMLICIRLIAKAWKQPRCPSASDRTANTVVHPDNEMLFGTKKEISYPVKRRPARRFHEYQQVKKANLKRCILRDDSQVTPWERRQGHADSTQPWLPGNLKGGANACSMEEFWSLKLLCQIL